MKQRKVLITTSVLTLLALTAFARPSAQAVHAGANEDAPAIQIVPASGETARMPPALLEELKSIGNL